MWGMCGCTTLCVVYVCVSLSVCVFKCTYVCVCLGVHVCVYSCMCLCSSAKALKPTKMFCCAVQHMAIHPLYAGQRELSSTHHRYCRIDCCVSEDLVEVFLLCKYLIDRRALLTQRH